MRIRKSDPLFDLIDPKVSLEVSLDPVKVFSEMSDGELKIFNCLLYWWNKGKQIYIRQDTLAAFAGFKSREYVNRLIGKFIKLGILVTNYRHKKSCLYRISSYFNDIQVRSYLKKYLPQLAYFQLRLLLPEVTQYISSFIYNIDRSFDLDQQVSKHVHERAYMRGNSIDSKKTREVMIKQYVEDIKKPVLTYQDKVQLSKYSEKAVRSALIKLQKAGTVRSPVGYMIVCCKSFDEKSANKNESNQYEDKEVKPPMYQQYKSRDVKDAAFWKIDNDKLAHRDPVYWSGILEKAKRDLSVDLANVMADRWRNALSIHNPSDCHLCIEFGESYVYSVYPNQSETKRHELKEPVTDPHELEYTHLTNTGHESLKESGQRSIRDILQDHFKGDF
jgi:hypothetical protein